MYRVDRVSFTWRIDPERVTHYLSAVPATTGGRCILYLALREAPIVGAYRVWPVADAANRLERLHQAFSRLLK